MAFKPVTHCIFDFDGLLVDTERLYFKIIDDVLKEFGHRYTVEIKLMVLGCTRKDCARIVIDHCRLNITIDEFLRLMEEKCIETLPKCQLLPGAERLVRHLVKKGIPIAIGTSSSLAALELKTTHHGDFMKNFTHLVSATDDPEVAAGKPAPDVFLVCAQRFESPPQASRVLVFEDAPNGVRAALAAGMQAVMVPDPAVVTQDQRNEATLCLNSLEHFEPELFGLPPFDDEILSESPPLNPRNL
ncbi:pseudouridine-5'-phosphatase [Galendromus occidentalis]|uniref:Pseudouridine-5'-phosphatase n=1 Tax=Galendromus occidentalis TaxID=34638 RepID=A0AAJ6VVJ8_9ACAR|nr:pseudouridine-5'-phosphatase [Galendromus occidentalis]